MIQRKVLFLCTGNSCRSQMAEAIVNRRWGEEWQAYSAGTHPSGYVHPIALQVLAEIGIKHEGRSKNAAELRHIPFDLVVTVCDSAEEECPLWLGANRSAHLGFPDPARASGSGEQILDLFRQIRNEISLEVPKLLKSELNNIL